MNLTKLSKIKKKELELLLQKIKPYPEPKPALEQYTTPAQLVAEVLFLAYPDLVGKKVLDLGCGTGRFAIGAKLLGARKSIGIDINERAIEIGRNFCSNLKLKGVEFRVCRVEDFNEKCDVVLMNPPFGAQLRHADRIFLKKALGLAKVVYSFHLLKTKKFIETFIRSLNAVITLEKRYKFPIPHMFEFHKKKVKKFDVFLLRSEVKM